jgi:hypothetical protein
MARLAIVEQGRLLEADPGDHPANEAVLFRHPVQLVQHAAAHQPEVAGVERDLEVGDAVQQPIEQRGCHQLERGFSTPLAALAVDDVRAFIHQPHHVGQQFRRVLQVGIDDQDAFAAADRQAGGQRQLVAVVARQEHGHHPRVGGAELAKDEPGAIRRSVVHEDDLIVVADLGLAHVGEPAVQLAQRAFLVVAR